MSDDETFRTFYSRLAEALFRYDLTGELRVSAEFGHFLEQAASRERAGREQFGLAYLTRDNPTEALEEFADGANYAMFTRLRDLEEFGDDPDVMRLALDVALYSFRAHAAAQELEAHLRRR